MSADEIRGHDWLPGEDYLAGVPRLYATDGVPFAKKTIWLHYFVGACDWYIAELGEDRRIAFGWACLGDPSNAEWGYVDLVELSKVVVDSPHRFSVAVERDLHWTPTVFAEVMRTVKKRWGQ